MSKLNHRKQFEQWFLKLDVDFTKDELRFSKSKNRYFFTKTNALYKQYIYIIDLKEALITFDEPHCNYLWQFECTVTDLLNRHKELL
jgi:hypothetical protein